MNEGGTYLLPGWLLLWGQKSCGANFSHTLVKFRSHEPIAGMADLQGLSYMHVKSWRDL